MKQQIILSALLATSALTLMAQDANIGAPAGDHPHRGPGGHAHHGPPIVGVLDANKDGVIDATEIANAPAELAKLDKNGDGQITLDELRPPRPANAPEPAADAPKRPLPPLLVALDSDGDGIISAAEIANAPASLAKLDKNGDGKLTPDEFMGKGPGRRGHGPRPDAAQQ